MNLTLGGPVELWYDRWCARLTPPIRSLPSVRACECGWYTACNPVILSFSLLESVWGESLFSVMGFLPKSVKHITRDFSCGPIAGMRNATLLLRRNSEIDCVLRRQRKTWNTYEKMNFPCFTLTVLKTSPWSCTNIFVRFNKFLSDVYFVNAISVLTSTWQEPSNPSKRQVWYVK